MQDPVWFSFMPVGAFARSSSTALREVMMLFPTLSVTTVHNAPGGITSVHLMVGLSSGPWVFPACVPCSVLGSDGTRQSRNPTQTFQKGLSFALFLASQAKHAAASHILGVAKKPDIWMDPWLFSAFDIKNVPNTPHSDAWTSDHVFTVVVREGHGPPAAFSPPVQGDRFLFIFVFESSA